MRRGRAAVAGALLAVSALASLALPDAGPVRAVASVPHLSLVSHATPALQRGGTFTMDVAVGLGALATDVVDAMVDFDPTRLQVQSVAAGANSPLSVLLRNTFDNTTGTGGRVNFSAGVASGNTTGVTGPAPGADFTLATITFQAVGATPGTPVRFSSTRPSGVYFGGAKVIAPDATPTLVGVRGVTLGLTPNTGTLTAGAVAAADLTVDTGPEAIDGVDVFLSFDPAVLQAVDAGGSPVTAISANGASPFTQPLANQVDNVAGTVFFSVGRPTTGSAIAGASTLATVRFKALTPSTGSLVTFSRAGARTTDAAALGLSKLGPFRAVPGTAAVGEGTAPAPAALLVVNGVALQLTPALVQGSANSVTLMSVNVLAGAQPVDAIDMYLSFDPERVRIVDVSGAAVTALTPSASSGLKATNLNTVDNAAGTITFSIGKRTQPNDPVPSGTFTAATFYVQLLGSGPDVAIGFESVPPRKTAAYFQAQPVLGGATGATVRFALPKRLVFTRQPVRGATTFALGAQPRVALVDATNTVQTDDSTTVVTIEVVPASGALTCPPGGLSMPLTAGVATFAGCKLATSGAGYVLRASATGIGDGLTAPFNITWAGDTNADAACKVTIVDFSWLVSNFGKNSSSAGWTTPNLAGVPPFAADLNGDGVVSILDFSILVSRFNTFLVPCAPASNGNPLPPISS